MIDTARQVPSPSASAWCFDLETEGGPTIVVLRTDLAEAREALEAHLLELGPVRPALANDLAQNLPAETVAVIW